MYPGISRSIRFGPLVRSRKLPGALVMRLESRVWAGGGRPSRWVGELGGGVSELGGGSGEVGGGCSDRGDGLSEGGGGIFEARGGIVKAGGSGDEGVGGSVQLRTSWLGIYLGVEGVEANEDSLHLGSKGGDFGVGARGATNQTVLAMLLG